MIVARKHHANSFNKLVVPVVFLGTNDRRYRPQMWYGWSDSRRCSMRRNAGPCQVVLNTSALILLDFKSLSGEGDAIELGDELGGSDNGGVGEISVDGTSSALIKLQESSDIAVGGGVTETTPAVTGLSNSRASAFASVESAAALLAVGVLGAGGGDKALGIAGSFRGGGSRSSSSSSVIGRGCGGGSRSSSTTVEAATSLALLELSTGAGANTNATESSTTG